MCLKILDRGPGDLLGVGRASCTTEELSKLCEGNTSKRRVLGLFAVQAFGLFKLSSKASASRVLEPLR